MSSNAAPESGSRLSTTGLFGIGSFDGLKQGAKRFVNCLLCTFRSSGVWEAKAQGNSLFKAIGMPIIMLIVRGWIQRPVVAPCLLYFTLLANGNAGQSIEYCGPKLAQCAIVNFNVIGVPLMSLHRFDGIHAVQGFGNDGTSPAPGASGIQPSGYPEPQKSGDWGNDKRPKVFNNRQPEGIYYWLWIAHGLGPQGLFFLGLLFTAAFAVLDMKFFLIEAIVDWWREFRFKPNDSDQATASGRRR